MMEIHAWPLEISVQALTAASLASTDEVVNASRLLEAHRGLSYEALGSGYRVQGLSEDLSD